MSAQIIIATLLSEHGTTGVQTHFNAFKREAERAGVDVTVVTPFSLSKWVIFPLFGLRRLVERLSSAAGVWWYRRWHYWALRVALAKILRKRPNAVLYAQCPLSAKAALLARTGPRQVVTMVVHFNVSQAEEWAGKGSIRANGRLYRQIVCLEAEVLPQLDRIVYVSRFSRSIIQKRIPAVGKVTSSVTPNFVPDPGHRPPECRISGDVVNIGTLEPRKNQSFLLEVIAEAKRRGKRYTLTLIGDGPDRARLEMRARALGIEEQVCFSGFRPDAARYLPEYRLYAHSALMESFGIALIEAMAWGMPVLAAPVGGIPEIFDDGTEGYYLSLNNVSAAADRLMTLLENPDVYARLSAAARNRFRSDFKADAVTDRLLTFLLKERYPPWANASVSP